jgi:hypothetical protein
LQLAQAGPHEKSLSCRQAEVPVPPPPPVAGGGPPVVPPVLGGQHTCPVEHALPQPPQFIVLSGVQLQLLLVWQQKTLPLPFGGRGHGLSQAWQCEASRATQLPQQSWMSPHFVPQLPQFMVSLRVSVQPLEQQVSGSMQPPEPLQRHSPLMQVLRLVHSGLQVVVTHTLFWHCCVAEQAMPQAPQ